MAKDIIQQIWPSHATLPKYRSVLFMRPYVSVGQYCTTGSPEVVRRGGNLVQRDKPLRASVPALQGSKGTER